MDYVVKEVNYFFFGTIQRLKTFKKITPRPAMLTFYNAEREALLQFNALIIGIPAREAKPATIRNPSAMKKAVFWEADDDHVSLAESMRELSMAAKSMPKTFAAIEEEEDEEYRESSVELPKPKKRKRDDGAKAIAKPVAKPVARLEAKPVAKPAAKPVSKATTVKPVADVDDDEPPAKRPRAPIAPLEQWYTSPCDVCASENIRCTVKSGRVKGTLVCFRCWQHKAKCNLPLNAEKTSIPPVVPGIAQPPQCK